VPQFGRYVPPEKKPHRPMGYIRQDRRSKNQPGSSEGPPHSAGAQNGASELEHPFPSHNMGEGDVPKLQAPPRRTIPADRATKNISGASFSSFCGAAAGVRSEHHRVLPLSRRPRTPEEPGNSAEARGGRNRSNSSIRQVDRKSSRPSLVTCTRQAAQGRGCCTPFEGPRERKGMTNA